MAIAIIGMLDEREAGLRLIRETIEQRGHTTVVVDISIGTGAIEFSLKAQVPCEEVAKAGGTSIGAVKQMLAKERAKAVAMMAEGLSRILQDLHRSGELQGVVAVGGMTGTFIGLSALRRLPFGLPKLLISSVAYAKQFAECLAVHDITVMHSVIDTVGLNPLVRTLMVNAAGAISGMVESYKIPRSEQKPSIAITEFGFVDKGAHFVRELLEKEYDLVSFHATGLGEKAACDLVSQGLFQAFIDLVPAGFSEYLLGGNRSAGPDRLDAGIQQGKPYILSPCGFDMISCGPMERKDENDPLWVSRNWRNENFSFRTP